MSFVQNERFRDEGIFLFSLYLAKLRSSNGWISMLEFKEPLQKFDFSFLVLVYLEAMEIQFHL